MIIKNQSFKPIDHSVTSTYFALSFSGKNDGGEFLSEMVSLEMSLQLSRTAGLADEDSGSTYDPVLDDSSLAGEKCLKNCYSEENEVEALMEEVFSRDNSDLIYSNPRIETMGIIPIKKLPLSDLTVEEVEYSKKQNVPSSEFDSTNLLKRSGSRLIDAGRKILNPNGHSFPISWHGASNVAGQPESIERIFLSGQLSRGDAGFQSLDLPRPNAEPSARGKTGNIHIREKPDVLKTRLDAHHLDQTRQKDLGIEIGSGRTVAKFADAKLQAATPHKVQKTEPRPNGAMKGEMPMQMLHSLEVVQPSLGNTRAASPLFESAVHISSMESETYAPQFIVPRLADRHPKPMLHERSAVQVSLFQTRLPDVTFGEPQPSVTVELIGDILDVTFTSSNKDVVDLMSRNQHELKATFKRLGIEGYEFNFNSDHSGSSAQKRSSEHQRPVVEIDPSVSSTPPIVEIHAYGIDKRV